MVLGDIAPTAALAWTRKNREGDRMVTMTAGQFTLCLIGAAVMGAVTLAVLAAMTVSGRGDA